jgi:hypothetical protein
MEVPEPRTVRWMGDEDMEALIKKSLESKVES